MRILLKFVVRNEKRRLAMAGFAAVLFQDSKRKKAICS
jgi:hypothetical protein